jgi:hypothetical protein
MVHSEAQRDHLSSALDHHKSSNRRLRATATTLVLVLILVPVSALAFGLTLRLTTAMERKKVEQAALDPQGLAQQLNASLQAVSAVKKTQ